MSFARPKNQTSINIKHAHKLPAEWTCVNVRSRVLVSYGNVCLLMSFLTMVLVISDAELCTLSFLFEYLLLMLFVDYFLYILIVNAMTVNIPSTLVYRALFPSLSVFLPFSRPPPPPLPLITSLSLSLLFSLSLSFPRPIDGEWGNQSNWIYR